MEDDRDIRIPTMTEIFQTTFPNGAIFIALALLFGFYMAWSIGANDVANAMGTSVGSKALTIRNAVIIAAIFELAGAVFVGGNVTDTVRKKIFDPSGFDPQLLVLGFIAALLAAAVWLQIATFKGWPVSTTHSIVGSIVGVGMVIGGSVSVIEWGAVLKIVASWVTSPLFGGLISFLFYLFVQNCMIRTKNPLQSVNRWTPALAFYVGFILSLVTVFKGLKNLKLDLGEWQAVGVSVGVGLIFAVVAHLYVRAWATKEGLEDEIEGDEENPEAQQSGEEDPSLSVEWVGSYVETRNVQRIFSGLIILSAAFLAFAHGANDVANAVGPIAGVLDIVKNFSLEEVIGKKPIEMKAALPLFVLIIGGAGIVIGLATWGYKVIQTIGSKITELTPSSGFAANIGAATTIVIASKLAMPISTTHTLIGAVLGVGFARGAKSLNFGVIQKIILSWVVTIPAGAILAILFYYILKMFLYTDPSQLTLEP